MSPRVAGSRRARPESDITRGAAVILALAPAEEGLEVRFENRGGVPDEDVIHYLEEAVAQMKRGQDRSVGLW